MLAAGNDGQFARLCQVLGRDDWALDARYATNAARVRNRNEVIRLLQELLSQRPVAYWTESLSRAGVPCGPINDIAQVFRDPQVQHRGMRIEMQHSAAGMLPLVGSPLRLSATPVQYRLPPPLLGEHTDQVLSELLGMGREEIEALRQARVV
jgi:crotonobetainyl-CoA:carnitine CoA-transferase CaiB-like acyl-CoA transferase